MCVCQFSGKCTGLYRCVAHESRHLLQAVKPLTADGEEPGSDAVINVSNILCLLMCPHFSQEGQNQETHHCDTWLTSNHPIRTYCLQMDGKGRAVSLLLFCVVCFLVSLVIRSRLVFSYLWMLFSAQTSWGKAKHVQLSLSCRPRGVCKSCQPKGRHGNVILICWYFSGGQFSSLDVHFGLFACFVLKQGSTVQPRLALNSPSSCYTLLNAWVIGIDYQASMHHAPNDDHFFYCDLLKNVRSMAKQMWYTSETEFCNGKISLK